jgi:ATP-dependent Clp protease ATP-binding subunit ClpA
MLEQQLEKRHLALEVTPAARDIIAAKGYDPVYGARPLKRVIQHDLQNPIALELLEGVYTEGDLIVVDSNGDGGLQFHRKPPVAEPVSA